MPAARQSAPTAQKSSPGRSPGLDGPGHPQSVEPRQVEREEGGGDHGRTSIGISTVIAVQTASRSTMS
jgi:hypothetical protein